MSVVLLTSENSWRSVGGEREVEEKVLVVGKWEVEEKLPSLPNPSSGWNAFSTHVLGMWGQCRQTRARTTTFNLVYNTSWILQCIMEQSYTQSSTSPAEIVRAEVLMRKRSAELQRP